jgi:hypothetical protein
VQHACELLVRQVDLRRIGAGVAEQRVAIGERSRTQARERRPQIG